MIKQPTVFVLGAGASAPYGFPLGRTLMAEIFQKLGKAGNFHDHVQACAPDADIPRFRARLSASGRSSIDLFLEKRPNFLDVGKAAIVRALAPYEIDVEFETLSKPFKGLPGESPEAAQERRARRWYHYLFDRMMADGELTDNKLSIITFNFDRSFERALYHVVEANYGGSASEIRKICLSIPVVHIHGSLGDPSWLSLSDENFARPYDAANFGTNDVASCANTIQIVTEEISRTVLARAHDLLKAAGVVCFLGFSYHPLNLKKLALENLTGKVIRGTRFKLDEGQLTQIHGIFHSTTKGNILLANKEDDILAFLQNTDVIHA